VKFKVSSLWSYIRASSEAESKLSAELNKASGKAITKLQAKLRVSSFNRVVLSFKVKLDKISLLGKASPLGSCEAKC